MSGPPGLEMKKKEDNVTTKRKIEEKLTLSLKTRQPFRSSRGKAQKLLLNDTRTQRKRKAEDKDDERPKKKVSKATPGSNVIGAVREHAGGWQVRTAEGIILERSFSSKKEAESVLRKLQNGQSKAEDYQISKSQRKPVDKKEEKDKPPPKKSKKKKRKRKDREESPELDSDDLLDEAVSQSKKDPASKTQLKKRRERLLKWKQDQLEQSIMKKVQNVDLESMMQEVEVAKPKKASPPPANSATGSSRSSSAGKTSKKKPTSPPEKGEKKEALFKPEPRKPKIRKKELKEETSSRKETSRRDRDRSRDRGRRRWREKDRDKGRSRNRGRRRDRSRADRKRRVRGSESEDETQEKESTKDRKKESAGPFKNVDATKENGDANTGATNASKKPSEDVAPPIIEQPSTKTEKAEPAKPETTEKQTSKSKSRSVSPEFPIAFAFDNWIPERDGVRDVDKCYKRLNTISEGVYGVVHRCIDRETREIVALKKIKLYKTQSGFPISSLREIGILLDLDHPNIVKVREVVVSETTADVFMVMEYAHNCMHNLIITQRTEFSTGQVKTLMRDLLTGLNFMHKKWYLHRDLKTANLLYTKDGFLKICDYGMARQFGEPLEAYTNLVVTPWYRAPELLLGTEIYGTPIDLWSCGCIFAEIFMKKVLFHGKGELNQLELIFELLGTPNEEIWPKITDLPHWGRFKMQEYPGKFNEIFVVKKVAEFELSEHGKDFLRQLLWIYPGKRLTAQQALDHPWFSEDPLPTPHDKMPTFQEKNNKEQVEERPPAKQSSAAAIKGRQNSAEISRSDANSAARS